MRGAFVIDQWSSSFAPRHSAQAPSALGLASVQRVSRALAILCHKKRE